MKTDNRKEYSMLLNVFENMMQKEHKKATQENNIDRINQLNKIVSMFKALGERFNETTNRMNILLEQGDEIALKTIDKTMNLDYETDLDDLKVLIKMIDDIKG